MPVYVQITSGTPVFDKVISRSNVPAVNADPTGITVTLVPVTKPFASAPCSFAPAEGEPLVSFHL
jgi:hypothetical protein